MMRGFSFQASLRRCLQPCLMLGLMLDDGSQTVFVKLTGDAELAAREKARFLEFAKSLQF